MEKKEELLDMGNIIRNELKSQRRSVVWLAKQIPCNRSTVYRMFNKLSLDSDLLHRLSAILKTDFFKYYQGDL